MGRDRKLSTLYRILGKLNGKARGICINIAILSDDNSISEKEYAKLIKHFEKQRPSVLKYPEFYDGGYFLRSYWWDTNDKEIRAKFVEMLRKNCRKERI